MQTGVKHDLKMDVRRSFNKLHIQVMREAFDALPAGPAKNRLRAIILTLELTGLRRSELSNATWRDVSHEYDEEKQAEYLLLRVIGKGNKERFVPLNAADSSLHMASLPEGANVQFVTVMATNMPFIGRG